MYSFELASKNDINKILDLYIKRIDWMDKKKLNSWNKTNYFDYFPREYFLNEIDNKNLYILKNKDLQKIIGAVIIRENIKNNHNNIDEKSYYLGNIVTDIYEKGVGTKLIGFAENTVKRQGAKKICLDCSENNKFLNTYYDSLGYITVGTIEIGSYKGNKREKLLHTDNL